MIFDTFSLLTGTVHRPRVHRTGFNEAYATILSPRSRTRSDHNPIFPEDRIINATPKRLRKPAFRIVGPCITRLWRCVERERERERTGQAGATNCSWFLVPVPPRAKFKANSSSSELSSFDFNNRFHLSCALTGTG